MRLDAIINSKRVIELHLEGYRSKDISKKLNMRYDTVRRYVKEYILESNITPSTENEVRSYNEITSNMRVKKVIAGHHNMYVKRTLEDGTVETITKPATSTKFVFEKKDNVFDEELFLKKLKKIEPFDVSTIDLGVTNHENDDIMAVVCLFDAHMDKVSIEEETGENNTFEANKSRYYRLAKQAIDEALKISNSIVLPLGNDLFNHDMTRSTTGGTPQDSSGIRNEYLFEIIHACIDIILYIAKHKGVKVTVPVIRGNHDENSCFILQEALKIKFCNYENVTIMDTAKRYYADIFWGDNAIVFCHGDKQKPDKFMHNYACEFGKPQNVRSISIFAGHLHRESVVSSHHMRYYTLRSVSCTDKWHEHSGYKSPKTAYVKCFHKDKLDVFRTFEFTE